MLKLLLLLLKLLLQQLLLILDRIFAPSSGRRIPPIVPGRRLRGGLVQPRRPEHVLPPVDGHMRFLVLGPLAEEAGSAAMAAGHAHRLGVELLKEGEEGRSRRGADGGADGEHLVVGRV